MKPNAFLCAVLVGGSAPALNSLAQPGSLDITFNPGAGADGPVAGIAVRSDGKIFIAGGFSFFNGVPRNGIARLNLDGGLDGGFDPMVGPSGQINAIAPQPDGKVIIGGFFITYNDVSRPYFTRLRTDGSLDITYPSVSLNGGVKAFAIQGDGKIVMTGGFMEVNGTNRNRIARMNPDGTLDLSFDPGTGPNATIDRLLAVSGGKFLISGLTSYNGTNRSYLARLNANGNLDLSFQLPVLSGSSVHAMAEQSDSKIVISGSFLNIDGYSRINIARVNNDGSLDLGFYLPGGIGGSVEAISIQSDGKILLTGNFSSVGGEYHPHIARLNTNGTLDSSYIAQVNSTIGPHIQQDGGKVIVGGSFTQINGTNINRIARLNSDSVGPSGFQFLTANRYFGTFLNGSLSNRYRIEWTTNLNTPSLWSPLLSVTLQTNPQFFLDPLPITGRQRYYRAVALP